MKKSLALLLGVLLMLFAVPVVAQAQETAGDSLPIALPIFENSDFTMTDARWTRPVPAKYWYTFKGTGMDAETILSLMAETGHTLVSYQEAALTENPEKPGTMYMIQYTYTGDEQLTLFPFGSSENLLSVQIDFLAYDDGSRKMTLFCAKELMYEPEEPPAVNE